MNAIKESVMLDIYKIQEFLSNVEIIGKDYHIKNLQTLIPVFYLDNNHPDFNSPRYVLYRKYPDHHPVVGVFVNDYFLVDDIIYGGGIDIECDIVYKGNIIGKIDNEGSFYDPNGKSVNLADLIKIAAGGVK